MFKNGGTEPGKMQFVQRDEALHVGCRKGMACNHPQRRAQALTSRGGTNSLSREEEEFITCGN